MVVQALSVSVWGRKVPSGFRGRSALPAPEMGLITLGKPMRSAAAIASLAVRTRSARLAAAEGNAALADELSRAQTLHGDWRAFFREQERVQALPLGDLSDAMRSAFTRMNRTTAMIVNPAPADSAAGGH